jgi:hypothetical protein
VIEILDTIFVPGLPSTLGPLMAYARLVGGVGGHACRFEIHDLDAEEVAAETPENLIEFGDADEVVTLIASLPPFEITGWGRHDLIMFVEDRDAGRFTIRVAPYQDDEGDHGAQEDEEP